MLNINFHTCILGNDLKIFCSSSTKWAVSQKNDIFEPGAAGQEIVYVRELVHMCVLCTCVATPSAINN